MKFTSGFALAFISTANVVLGSPFNLLTPRREEISPRICGTTITDEARRSAEEHFAYARRAPAQRDYNNEEGRIGTVFHVIYANRTIEGGYVPLQQITDQMTVLNAAYEPTGFYFALERLQYVQNASWFNGIIPEDESEEQAALQNEMKTELRLGLEDVLNVYTLGFPTSGVLGAAAFPSEYANASITDGIILRHTTLPQGSGFGAPYNLGYTLVHEAGHWAGLYHTFQGGCEEQEGGDLVADTPAQANSTSGCPAYQDTCPGKEGIDGVHNYMDYADDACMTEFTEGQINRMQEQMRVYRGVKALF